MGQGLLPFSTKQLERKNGALGRVETRRVRQHPAPVFRNEAQKTTSTKPPTDLEVDGKAQKRAQWEQFNFDAKPPARSK